MKNRNKNKIFNSIRKQVAPPTRVFEDKKEKMINKYLDDDENDYVQRYYVDIPNINEYNDSTTFINVATFYTKQEAINFAKMYYGADDEGKICLISEG